MEGAIALDDRVTLAQLEWRAQKHRLLRATLLFLAVGVLATVALISLTLALLLQFWDTPQRLLVAWLLALGWLVGMGVGLAVLVSLLRQINNGFALTRQELAQDRRRLVREALVEIELRERHGSDLFAGRASRPPGRSR